MTAEAITTDTFAELQTEVRQTNTEKGWYETQRSFREGLALIHSEVSEALEAYRVAGVADQTGHYGSHDISGLPKPEGVGSELADVLIRVLDQLDRCSQLAVAPSTLALYAAQRDHEGLSFAEDIHDLHRVLVERPLDEMIAHLLVVADKHGIDLLAEARRKMAYNATRPHRHGGKRL